MTFKSLLFLVHLQAVLVPIFLGLKSHNKFKNINFPILTTYSFISLGLASMFEMIDHTTTNWIYINHTSIFNWLFYSILSLGLSTFTIAISKNKLNISINILLILAATFSYWFIGKPSTILFHVLISFLLIIQWWSRFKDWVFLIYPITGVLFTTISGILLSNSGEQIWHLLIGPSGTISVLSLYYVLKRSRKKEILS